MNNYPVGGARSRHLTLAMLFAAIMMIAGCGDLYDHKDFTNVVMNKSEVDVAAKLGKPKSVDGSDPEHVKWIYSGVTFDPENRNNTDSKTIVVFSKKPDGSSTVTDVKFER